LIGQNKVLKPLLDDQTISHQLPQVLHRQRFHAVLGFDAVDLSVAGVARHNEHLCTRGSDLFHFTSAVKDALIVIAVGQSPSPSAAADLIDLIGVQVHPPGQALVHNPARFGKVAVTEPFPGPPAVVAWIVVGGRHVDAVAV